MRKWKERGKRREGEKADNENQERKQKKRGRESERREGEKVKQKVAQRREELMLDTEIRYKKNEMLHLSTIFFFDQILSNADG